MIDGRVYYYDYETPTHSISQTIALTKDEHQLLEIISQVRNRYSPRTTVRVAGGWVRDKLLQIPFIMTLSHPRDIDFVLDNISGKDFSLFVEEYLNENSVNYTASSKQYFNKKGENSNIPSSDHLETASLRVNGFDLDFCRLRREQYNSNSRIPSKVGVACAIQDAWRRDLTINSLFYNLNTNQVEDWTEQGLPDLQSGLIATPLPAKPTLLQDPLRILRAIRFAAQFSFTLDRDLVAAAQDHRVQTALKQKVSKDRMGNEINGVFQTRDPARGVQYLLDTNTLDVVFGFDDYDDDGGVIGIGKSLKVSSSSFWFEAGFNVLSRSQAVAARVFVGPSEWDETRRSLFWYAAFFQPAHDYQERTDRGSSSSRGSKRKKKNRSIVYQLLTCRLKRPTSETLAIERILSGSKTIQLILEKLREEKGDEGFDSFPTNASLSDLRWMCYNELKSIGCPFCWKESLLLALVTEIDMDQEFDIDAVKVQYQSWLHIFSDSLGLEQFLNGKRKLEPLLDGSKIRQYLDVSGREFRQVMKAQEEWQVRHFHNEDVESCGQAELVDFLRMSFPEYTRK